MTGHFTLREALKDRCEIVVMKLLQANQKRCELFLRPRYSPLSPVHVLLSRFYLDFGESEFLKNLDKIRIKSG